VSLTVGTRLGPYQITAKIGEGGMGEVYRATDTQLKRAVALKVLPASVATDPERLARFQREAEVLASLNHPNIAQIHGLEKADVTALAMELVEGPTLADRIARGPIPVDEALPIATQIAEALEAAHERSIIHRDLKPANIKVRDDGMVKVFDFGLAKAIEPISVAGTDATASPTITSPALMTGLGMLLGTAAYMSPEQARGKPVDRRADIWAFGCVLYEMLTGRRAFEAEDVSLTLSMVLQRDPAFDALPADVPARVRQAVRLCLVKPLRERIPDIGVVRLLLEGAFDTVVVHASEAGARAQTAWRRALPFLLTAIGATVFGGLVVWRLMPARVPEPRPVMRFALPSSASIAPMGAGTGRHVLAMSPQGTHLVSWADDQLYLRAMDRLDAAVAIRGTERAREPFFSPDGQWIGFHQDTQLKRVSVNGGAPVVLGEAQNPWGVSWDIDGVIRYGQGGGGVWQVPAAGGTPTQLVGVAEGELAHGPQLLPVGQWLLFTLRPASVDSWDEAQIVAQSLESGQRIVLIERGRDARYLPTGHLVYGLNGVLLGVPFDVHARRVTGAAVPLIDAVMDADVRTGAMHFSVATDGALVYLRASSGERSTLMWVTRDGRRQPLSADALPYSTPRLSRDGAHLAVEIAGQGGLNIHIYDLARGTLTQLTSSPSHGRYPLWTPDSQRVLFYDDLDGGGLFSKAADGTGTVQRLTRTRAIQIPYSWSPDGRTVLLEQRRSDVTASGDVYVLSLAGEPTAAPLIETPTDEFEPALSRDGRWLAYTSREAGSTTTDVFVRPFPNVDNGRWRISTAGGISPLWSPDGRELFFISRPGGAAWVMSVKVEAEQTFRAGTPTRLFELPPFYGSMMLRLRRQWDITPDGKRFLVVSPGDLAASGEPSPPQTVVVLNWHEELKRLVPAK
jgi:eukaryotic-like serine/threonine-protein kinase